MATDQLTDRSVMHEAAEALLDAGISLPLVLVRLPWRDAPLTVRVVMRRPTLGSQIRVAKKFLELGVSYEQLQGMSEDEAQAFLAHHGRALSELVALCILRGRLTGKWLVRPLAWLLRWRTPSVYLLGALTTWIALQSMQPFTNTIRYIEMTQPLSLSHKTKGS